MTVAELVQNTPEAWSERAHLENPWDAACWTQAGQRDRFTAVLRHLDIRAGDTVFDFGAGPGEFYWRLPPVPGEYHAFDWAEGMQERIRRDIPAAKVHRLWPERRFDHVVAIGPFNLRDRWSKEETWRKVDQLWAITTRTLVVSLYTGGADDRCISYLPSECAAKAVALTVNGGLWTVEKHRANDLLLVAHRP